MSGDLLRVPVMITGFEGGSRVGPVKDWEGPVVYCFGN